jgi:hypothetical protein
VILRNPTGRPVRLEIPTDEDDAAMSLTIGPHASVDLARYQRALDALGWAARAGNADDPVADDEDTSTAIRSGTS